MATLAGAVFAVAYIAGVAAAVLYPHRPTHKEQ